MGPADTGMPKTMQSTTQPANRRLRNGYTLMELMIAVGIVGVTAMVATPGILKRMPFQRLNRASWQVCMDLQRAKMQAVSENTTVRVTFDNGNETYVIWVDSDRDGAIDTGEQTTRSLRDIRGADLYAYPTVGTFQPRGTMESTYSYWYIRVLVPEAGYKYVYIFPNGHIDPYNMQDS